MSFPLTFGSKLVIYSTAIASRIFLSTLGGKITVQNRETLHRLVFHRPRERGLITVSNHASVLDDPVIWACAIKLREFFKEPQRIRWILGAQEICFKNRIYSWFFSRGRVIPIVRGAGLTQDGVSRCIELLRSGEWVHVFSEGKVNQSKTLLPFRSFNTLPLLVNLIVEFCALFLDLVGCREVCL
jgi:monolysocardiolipin acyltransferase